MRKIVVFVAFLVGLLATPVFAKDVTGTQITIEKKSSAYQSRRNRDYWTRVWYEKQARKGKRYKRKVYRNGRKLRKKRRYNNRVKVRRVSKRKRSRKRSSYRPRVSSKNVRPGRCSRVLAKISLSSQRMNVYQGGRLLHSWKVSTGRKGYSTPRGTWRIHRMHKRYFSKKYDNAPMPYAMFYSGGFAVHGTNSIKRLGRRASHGCVRLHPSNAAQLFAMVRRNGGTVKVTN